MKFRLIAALALAFAGGAVALAGPAAADGDCKTYVTEDVVRPDSGEHGNWATDTFTRTVKVCESETPGEYVATFTDEGSFAATEGANSPGKDDPVVLPAGITGSFTGGATYVFTASPDLDLAALNPHTTDGTYPSTGEWVKAWLGDKFTGGAYADGGTAWSWEYATDCEKWVNSGKGNQGNITKVCPTDDPTDEPTKDPTDGPSGDPTAQPTVEPNDPPGTGGGAPILPVTGTSAAALGGVGLALIGGGALLLLVRRKREFEV